MAARPRDGSGSDMRRGATPAGDARMVASVAPAEPLRTLVPDWLINLATLGWRILAIAALAIVLVVVATTLWTVTASIAVAIIISAVFAPLVLRLRDRGRSRNAAALIVWAAAVAALAGIVLLLALAFLPVASELASRIQAGLTALGARLSDVGVPAWVETLARDAAGAVEEHASAAVGAIIASAASGVTILILSAFLVFFFLRDGDKAWLWIFQGAGQQKRERITAAGDEALARVGGYLRGTTILSAIIALTDLVFMWLLGVPLAAPLTVLVFFAGYIPYFGGIIATAAILLVSLAALGTGPTLILLILMALRSVILGWLVRPAVYGRTVHVHPALVLLALPAGFQLAGVVGLFAAVPVTAIVLAVASATVAIIEPSPPPPLPELVPAWLDRLAQFSWRILVALAPVALFVAILVSLPLVVIPLILAFILAATLDPVVQALLRRGRSRSRAAAVAVGGGFLLVTVILLLAFGSLFAQAGSIGDSVIRGASSVDEAAGGQLGLGSGAVEGVTGEAIRTIAGLADAMASIVTVTLLGVLITFYFLRDGGVLWQRAMERVRPGVRSDVDAAGARAFEVLGGYMIGTAAISFVGAASQLVIMVVLDLPLALPIFVLSFFLGFIPYIGGFISTGIAFLIAISAGTTADVVVMGIWTIAFNLVQGNVVAPLVYGRTVHIHPAIVLVCIPAASAVAGILGMFVVVPALGVVATTWRTALAVLGTPVAPIGPPEAQPPPEAPPPSTETAAPRSEPGS